MSLFAELKRRNVLRVAAAYVVTAWLIVQVAETLFPIYGLSDAAVRVVVNLLAIGLVPALVLSWVFEWTPEGFKRESDVDVKAPASLEAARRLDRIILIVLALALVYFAFDRFVLAPQREATVAEEARQEGRSEALVESYGEKSIAVLPFRDMSPEGDQEYFSEGIAEELLNLLARESQLRVISRTSAFAFKDQALEVPEIAKRLKVGHVLEGSVRKSGNTVRITAQLIEARSDTHLWSQTWDRELTDILAIQDEIAAAVAESLQTVLLGPVGSASAAPMTEGEIEAYELVLKGRHLLNQGTQEAYQRALPMYERAIEVAPDYAPAYSGLAKVLRPMTNNDLPSVEPEVVEQRIEAALDRALELNPEDSDALATRGAVLGLRWMNPDIQTARKYWMRAIAINPNDGDALRWLSFSYMESDSVRYLQYIERAYRVAPTNALVSMWFAYALSRFNRFDEALEVVRDWHNLDPNATMPFSMAGNIYYLARQAEKAVRSYYLAYRMAPERVADEISGLVWLLLDTLPESSDTSSLALRWANRCIAIDPNCSEGYFQRVISARKSGGLGEARRLIGELEEQHPEWWPAHAVLQMMVNRDYSRSREWWDVGEMSLQSLDQWDTFLIVHYAFVLSQTGDSDHALEIIDMNLERARQQMASGVKLQGAGDLTFYVAILHAMKGENREALNYLRQDAADGAVTAVTPLRIWPEFDGLRDDPEFHALIAEQDEITARRYWQLDEAGLLLTPEEVLALDDFDFDPFAEMGSE